MKKPGQSVRIHCEAICLLNHEGVNYQGVVENISLTGALIKMSDKIPSGLYPGDKCGLLLCNDPAICPVKYTCNVVRIDTAYVGVQFLELNCNI